jgi:hypothetical protein
VTRRRKKRGRRAWKPTKAQRQRVRTLTAMGTGVRDVARIIGTTVPTLRKHCAHELATSRAEADAAVMLALHKAATNLDRPNVRAMRAWLELSRDPDAPRVARAPAPGKKETRKAAAQRIAASGRFQPGAPPKLVVDNTKPRTGSDDEPSQ